MRFKAKVGAGIDKIMRETQFTRAIDKLVDLEMAAIDRLIKDYIEPLGDIGNPEKLIGKQYEDWTPQDLQSLVQVYGSKEPNTLSNFIFKKEYARIKKLEQEVV